MAYDLVKHAQNTRLVDADLSQRACQIQDMHDMRDGWSGALRTAVTTQVYRGKPDVLFLGGFSCTVCVGMKLHEMIFAVYFVQRCVAHHVNHDVIMKG